MNAYITTDVKIPHRRWGCDPKYAYESLPKHLQDRCSPIIRTSSLLVEIDEALGLSDPILDEINEVIYGDA